jgi:cupin 2 domain-containing protein
VNIYDYLTPQSGETFTTLLEHKNIKINRIVSSDDLDAKVYIQEEEEWLVVLEGQATLLLNDEKKTLLKGDTLFIPAKTPHSILHTKSNTVWLAVHIF